MDQNLKECIDAIKKAVSKADGEVTEFDIGYMLGKAKGRKEKDEEQGRISK